MRRLYSPTLLACLLSFAVHAQDEKLDKSVMVDTLDGKFDLSRFIIDFHGFIPLAFIITEPALGGFGAGVAPVYIKKRAPIIDTVRGEARIWKTSPDITGFAAMYTINNSYLLGGFRIGTWTKLR